jgi:long-chain acyl-CoA synthetase
VFTSGTTGTPKGVILSHDNVVASIESFHRIVPPMDHRIVSLLPLSHLLEQAVGLYYALDVGADVLYVRSRNPRVIFDALRDHRVTSMVVVPQVLDCSGPAIGGRSSAAGFASIASMGSPATCRSVSVDGCSGRARPVGGHFQLFRRRAFLPPALQQGWEGPWLTVLRGWRHRDRDGHVHDAVRPWAGHRGATTRGHRRAATASQFRGRTVPAVLERPGGDADVHRRRLVSNRDIGHLDDAGRLILAGRTKDIIVLPQVQRVSRDIGNALRIAGIRDSVVVETRPGRMRRSSSGRPEHSIPGAPPRDADPCRIAVENRRRGQGGQREPRAEPADRRLAVVAGRGLPADPHAQGQARPRPGLGRRRHATPGRLTAHEKN